MRFFSKIVFICNICFIISAVMRLVEFGMLKNGNTNAVIPLQAVEGTIVVLGFIIAVILNAAFVLIVLVKKFTGKPLQVNNFMLLFNFILFPIEIWYSFFVRN